MAPTKAQKAAKAAQDVFDPDDNEQSFMNKSKQATKQLKDRQDKARARIRKDHGKKQQDIETAINALNGRAPIEVPGSGGDVSTSDDTFDNLRRLLARKAHIEQRIAASIQGLELAVQTTSRELQVVLTTRAAAVTATSTSTDPVNH